MKNQSSLHPAIIHVLHYRVPTRSDRSRVNIVLSIVTQRKQDIFHCPLCIIKPSNWVALVHKADSRLSNCHTNDHLQWYPRTPTVPSPDNPPIGRVQVYPIGRVLPPETHPATRNDIGIWTHLLSASCISSLPDSIFLSQGKQIYSCVSGVKIDHDASWLPGSRRQLSYSSFKH